MSTRQTVVFQDFKGGEYGDKAGWKAPRNSFTAINMLVNRQGELMVRPGLINRTPSGVAAGIVRGFGDTGIPTQDAWYVQGTTVKTFDILSGNNLETATGSLSGTPTSPISSFVATNQIYLTARGLSTSYVLNNVPATPTLTALTGAPAGTTITVYGDRWIIGDIESSLDNRIRYSDAANPNSWPAANFIDIGDGWGVRALWPQRQHLVIMKQTGAYVLTGVPGVNEVLRFVGKGIGPLSPNDVVCSRDDMIWWWQGTGVGLAGPAVFTGSQVKALNYLNNHIASGSDGESFPPGTGVQGTSEDYPDGVFFCSDENKGILYQNGVFTYHTFGVNTSGFLGRGQNGRVYICDGGSAGTAPKFYVWNYWADTPGIEGGDQMRAGDDSASPVIGNVTFPEWWAESGAEVRVRAVIVDFRKWNTGGSANNHFDLSVDLMRRYNTTSPLASNTVSFDESPASSSSTGTLDRRIFGFGEQGPGNGFQLNFTNCKGIAIQRVEVILDSDPVRI